MKRLLVMGMAVMTGVSAFGAEYWYWGPSNVWDDVSCYTMDEGRKTPADEKPGAGDTVYLKGDKDYYIDDSTIGFFKTIGGVYVRYANTHVNIHLERDAEFGCHIGEFAQRSLADQFIVKTGPGSLIFSKTGCTHGSGQNWYDYNIGLDVREGDVYLEPSDGVSSHRNYHRDLIVAKGCTIHCVTNGINWVNSIAGEGTITTSPDDTGTAELTLTGTAHTPAAVFSGKLTGKWKSVYFGANQRITGTANDFTGTTRLQGYGGDPAKGVTGFMTLATPSGQPSSLGTSASFDSRAPFRLLYLGDTGETIVRNINQIWDTASAPCVIDGGHHGGLVWTGTFGIRNQLLKQQRLGLSGSNTVACVLSNAWTKVSDHGTNCSFYVTKDGTGTWRFLHRDDRKWSGALAVKEGTVEFDTLAREGKLCAIGTADELYEDRMDYPANLQAVPYAWLLGTAGDVSKVGTLSYIGDEDFQLESRKTSLAGAGRLRTKAGSLLKYSAGITGYGAGEKEIRFENGEGATNVVSGVSNGADGAVVSVVKEGVGSYTLTGDLGFTGDLRVLGGDLTLKDINGAKYEWYRYTFKENRCSCTNEAYAAYTVNKNDNYAGQCTRLINLNEVGLYDANGKRVNQNGTSVEANQTNRTYLVLEPGQVGIVGAELQALVGSKNGSQDVRRLFENRMSGGCTFKSYWKDRNKYPQFDDPDTWFVVYQRLREGVNEAVRFDLCYDGETGSSLWQGGPTAFAVEGSADGVTWQELYSTNNVVYSQGEGNSYGWLSNDGGEETWNSVTQYPETFDHPGLPLAASRQQGTYARPVPRSVEVAANAALVVDGGTLTVNRLTTDEFGVGRMEGVTFASAGTLSVCGLSRLRNAIDLGGTFLNCTGVGNLANWRVEIEGEAMLSRKYRIDVGPDGRLTLAKRQGFLVMIGGGSGSVPSETLSLTAPTVVIAPKAPNTVRFAATEMTNFLSQALGREVPLATSLPAAGEAIVLGTNAWSRAAGLAPERIARDGFEILAEAGSAPRVYIAGCDDPSVNVKTALEKTVWGQHYERGTYHGVMAFLEDCAGCRFYFPGELGTVVPRRTSLDVPVGRHSTEPAMSIRRYSMYESGEWYESGLGLSTNALMCLNNMRLRMETQLGPPCCHGSAKLSLVTRFGSAHPEYFALYGGKRLNVLTGDRDGQLCHTSDVWNEMYLDATSYLRGEAASVRGVCYRDDPTRLQWDWNFREGKYVDIMPQDAMKVCSCENCIAAFGGISDGVGEQIWRKTAAFADRLTADGFADARVTQMAYGYARDVPQVDIPSNVLVTVAETGPWAAAQPEEFRRELDEIAAWRAKLGGRKTWIWTYLCKYGAKHIPDVPCGTPRACARFCKAAAKDVYGIFAESEIDRFLYQSLDIYILSRICWDPSVDTDAVIAEYYRLMFGRAANGMEAIADLLEEKWLKEVNANVIDTTEGPSIVAPSERQLWTEIYTPTFLTRLRELFDRSAEAVPAGSAEARRIALFRSAWLDPLRAAARKYADESDPYAALVRDARLTNAQLVVDSDFSGTDARWGEIGWLRDNTSSGSAFARDEETFVSVPKSVRLTSTGNMILTQYLSGRSDVPDLKPGCRYRLSFNLKLDRLTPTSASGGGAHVVVNDGVNVSFPSTSAFSGTFDWTHFSYEFTTRELEPGQTITPYVRLRIDNAAGTAWFDDVRLDELPLVVAD